MENLLSDYRRFFWFYDTLLTNTEMNISDMKRVDKICMDARERKYFNFAHSAGIEISAMQYRTDINFEKIVSDIKKDLHGLRPRFEAIITKYNDYKTLQEIFFSFKKFEKIIENLTPKKQPPQAEKQSIDQILNQMFSLTDYELTTLKNNLNGTRQYINLTFTGRKNQLWKYLAQLLTAGIDRKIIAEVFSSYCKWKSSHTSAPKKLKYAEVYKKIGQRGAE